MEGTDVVCDIDDSSSEDKPPPLICVASARVELPFKILSPTTSCLLTRVMIFCDDKVPGSVPGIRGGFDGMACTLMLVRLEVDECDSRKSKGYQPTQVAFSLSIRFGGPMATGKLLLALECEN